MSSFRGSGLVGALAVAVALGGCSAAAEREGVAVRAAIFAADGVDTTGEFIAVVSSGSCTATLITPCHILLAGHCVDFDLPPTAPPATPGATFVRTTASDTVSVGGERCRIFPGYWVGPRDGRGEPIPGSEPIPQPGYGLDECRRPEIGGVPLPGSGTDFAVVRLRAPVAHPVPDAAATASGPVQTLPIPVRTLPLSGASVRAIAVGFGDTARDCSGIPGASSGADGNRRFRRFALAWRNSPTLTVGQRILLQGDSGGPLLYEGPDGIEVIGVASSTSPCGTPESIWANVVGSSGSSVPGWIQEQIDEDGDGRADFTCAIGTTGRRLLGRGANPNADATNDRDGDYYLDTEDTCPDTFNPCQFGTDADHDGVDDDCELCPADPRVRFQLGEVGEAGAEDGDGDGVPDVCDCSFVADRTDIDGDFIRDACDVCDDAVDTAQADCDADGIGDACSADDDGDGRIDVCGFDNCVGVGNAGQENCNAEVEGLLGRAPRGDACDASPCGEATLLTRNDRRGPVGRDVYAVMDRVEIDARAAVTAGLDARLGVRFCPCELATSHDSPFERAQCALSTRPTNRRCTLDDTTLYDRGERADAAWREVTMLWPSPAPGPAGGVDPRAPLTILSGARPEVTEAFGTTDGPFVADLGPRWLLESDDRPRWSLIFGESSSTNSPLPGVLWTHAPGLADGTFLAGDARTLASHFWSSIVEPPTFLYRTPIPCAARLAPFLGGESCPLCGASFPEPFIGLPGLPGSGGLCRRGPGFVPWLGFDGGFRDGAGLVPIEPTEVGDPPRWIAAVEPTELLPALRYALLSPGGALLDTVSLSFGRLGLDSTCGPNGCVCPNPPCSIGGGALASRSTGASAPAPEALAVLSATTERLWLVGVPGPGPDARRTIIELDLAHEGRIFAVGAFIGTPLAATYLQARDRLVVLDETERAERAGRRGGRRVRETRLLYIDVDRGVTEVMATWQRLLPTTRFALAPSADGSLYLAASGEHGPHIVVRFLASEDGVQVLGVGGGRRPIVPGGAHASRLGLSLGIEEPDGRAGIVGYRVDALRAPRPRLDAFEDCF